MKRCACGELVESHTRYHWTDFAGGEGHYVDGQERESKPARPGAAEQLESWPPNLVRASSLWGPPPATAPPPGEVPPKSFWPTEAELRRDGSKLMKTFGFAVYDLEQGFRVDQSSRVTEGIGDTYFHGEGIRGWIEWKRWDNEPSDAQRAFGLEELAHGGIYLLVYETEQLVHWNQLRRELS